MSGPITDLELPAPSLRLVYRMRAELAEPLDFGDTPKGHRRLVPFTSGRFEGPGLSGTMLPGASADWQLVQPDGTAVVAIRYTLRADTGALLLVDSRGVRHGPREVLDRMAANELVPADEYTYRMSLSIETSDPELAWLNRGVFVAVGARERGAVVYEVYLVE